MMVIRKIGQQEWARGKYLTVKTFENPLLKGGKDMTSSLLSAQSVKRAKYIIFCYV